MTLSVTSDTRRAQARSEIQIYARTVGLLLLVSLSALVIDAFYLSPQLVVWRDAAATAAKIKSLDFVFRLSFVVHLVQIISDTALSLAFYVVLKAVNRDLALLGAFFGLLSAGAHVAAQIFYFPVPHVLLSGADYLKTLTPEQLNTLSLASLKVCEYANGAFKALWGIAWILRGYLMLRSGYMPWILGAFLIALGVVCIAWTLLLVLAPTYSVGIIGPALLAGAALTGVWFLIRGVNVRKWEASAESEVKPISP
jgi:hypothetical protein